jgi:hypothetical protein
LCCNSADAHRKTQEYNDQKHLEEELHSEIRQLQASLNDHISANAKATELRACSVADLGSCPNQLSVFQLLKESDEAYQNLYKYIGDNIPDSESNSCAECSTDWVADLNTIMLSALKGRESFSVCLIVFLSFLSVVICLHLYFFLDVIVGLLPNL